jgi:guanylate kinase
MDRTGRLFVVSGPSGSGKSTLCKAASARLGMYLSVSATTRAAGPNEQNGRDYYFMTETEFLKKVKSGEFLEHAKVFDHYYGTPAGPVLERLARGEDVLLEIDVQGGEQVFAKYPEAKGVLVLPPSFEELRNRLSLRRRDDEVVIDRRLAKAKAEVAQAHRVGYYHYEIVNDKLEDAIEKLVQLISTKESSKTMCH